MSTARPANENRQAVPPMGRGPGGPGLQMMMPGQKAKDFRRTMGQLATYLRPFWPVIAGVVLLTVASTALAVLVPRLLGQMTNQVVADFTTRTALNYDRLGRLAAAALALIGASAGLNYVQQWLMTGVAARLSYRFRREIVEKMGRMPLRYFDAHTHGEVLSRITNDVDTVTQTLNQTLTQLLGAAVTLLGILAMMLSISWQLTLVALVSLPLSFGLIGVVVRHSQRHFRAQQAVLGRLNGHVEEMYGGHSVMCVCNGRGRSLTAFAALNNELHESAWRSQFLSGLLHPVINFVGNLSYVAVAVIGGWLALRGRLRIGDIQAFIQYVNQFHQPVIQSASIASVVQATAAAAERVFEFLVEDEEMPDPPGAIALGAVQGAVEFDHVQFAYNGGPEVIHDFTASVKPGQSIAIVGPTGAGKTTMVNLLMRFYDVRGGAIRVDGVDVRELRRADLRRLFGMVLQDTWLFNGTVRENLAYGRPDATEEEIVAAARAAHVDHFIRSQPRGYGLVIDEEAGNLSQGEKQLLTIARAMLADAPMLILDEATSSVDTRTEVLIQQAMDRLMEGRTCFIIAHRLSTIRHADLILVMRDGRLVEQGRHEDLLARGGFYAELYNSQFHGGTSA